VCHEGFSNAWSTGHRSTAVRRCMPSSGEWRLHGHSTNTGPLASARHFREIANVFTETPEIPIASGIEFSHTDSVSEECRCEL
jgi:hypothetical protein